MTTPGTPKQGLIAFTPNGSLERWIRTLVHVALALPAAVAILANTPLLQGPHFHSALAIATKDAGVTAATVLAISAAWNTLEAKGVIPAMLRHVPPTPAVGPATTVDLHAFAQSIAGPV